MWGKAGQIFGVILVILGVCTIPISGKWGGFVLFSGMGGWCFMRGKRLCAITAHDLLAQDSRPPVIYLRSFNDDKVTKEGTVSDIWDIFTTFLWDSQTEEELLVEVLTEIGPVIAIGIPGEELPELGAARLYVGDAEWRQVVHSHLERAKLVGLRLGDTPGFWWELEHSVKTLAPSQLLLIVPFQKSRYDAFREKAAGHFPHPLPEYGGVGFFNFRRTRKLKSLRGLVYFKPDWTPVFVDISRFSGRLNTKLKQGLSPVFEQLQMPWKLPEISWWYWGCITFASLMFPFSLLVPFFLWSKVRHCDGQSRGSLVAARIILALSIFTTIGTIGGVILVFRR